MLLEGLSFSKRKNKTRLQIHSCTGRGYPSDLAVTVTVFFVQPQVQMSLAVASSSALFCTEKEFFKVLMGVLFGGFITSFVCVLGKLKMHYPFHWFLVKSPFSGARHCCCYCIELLSQWLRKMPMIRF